MIPGGKFLIQRDALQSELWENKPSWWFKVWVYILANANFKDHNKKLQRGDLLTTYGEIYKGCHLAQEGVKQNAIDNLIRHLKSTKQLTTRKTTRGFIISVSNYNKLQSFEAFSNDTQNDTSNGSETTQERHDKETNVTNVTTYNYLPTSKTGKENTLGENPNLGTYTQRSGNTPPVSQPYKEKAVGVTSELGSASQPKQSDPRKIFLSNLNRVKRNFDTQIIGKNSPERLVEEGWSLNTHTCVGGIQYYLKKFKAMCGVDHEPLKLEQITKCFYNFNWVIAELEQLKLPPNKIDEIIERAIDRWFATTSPSTNNLNLNHFAGINKKGEPSLVIDNSVEEVLYELGILSSKPKAVHLEDVI